MRAGMQTPNHMQYFNHRILYDMMQIYFFLSFLQSFFSLDQLEVSFVTPLAQASASSCTFTHQWNLFLIKKTFQMSIFLSWDFSYFPFKTISNTDKVWRFVSLSSRSGRRWMCYLFFFPFFFYKNENFPFLKLFF